MKTTSPAIRIQEAGFTQPKGRLLFHICILNYTFYDVKMDLGRLDVVGRALVVAGVPGGGGARDRQPRLDGVASVRRFHLRVARGRRRDPLTVSKPSMRGVDIS